MRDDAARKPYPSDVSDEERSMVVPYLVLLREDAEQQLHALRELFNALRYVIRYEIAWRTMPNDLPPGSAVYQQSRCWPDAACFDALVSDLRAVMHISSGRTAEPLAAILDCRTLRSTPESGSRAGYDGAKRKKGSKLHPAIDTLRHQLALHVTPASRDYRAEVERFAAAMQHATAESLELAYVDHGYTGKKPVGAIRAQRIDLDVVRLPEAKRGFVLLPRRGGVERSSAWATRRRRLVKGYEHYASTLTSVHS